MLHRGGDNHVLLNRLREMRSRIWRVYKGDERVLTYDAVCRDEGSEIMGTIRIFIFKMGTRTFGHRITFKLFRTVFTDRPETFGIQQYYFKQLYIFGISIWYKLLYFSILISFQKFSEKTCSPHPGRKAEIFIWDSYE
jgi:hypothetical protein